MRQPCVNRLAPSVVDRCAVAYDAKYVLRNLTKPTQTRVHAYICMYICTCIQACYMHACIHTNPVHMNTYLSMYVIWK